MSILNTNTRLIIASKETPKVWISNTDLASRFSLSLLFRVKPLDDDGLVFAAQHHAKAEGLNLMIPLNLLLSEQQELSLL